MNSKQFFECSHCRKEHEDEYDARHCCDLDYVFRCGSCNKSHHYEDDAEKCCNLNENEKLKEQLKLG